MAAANIRVTRSEYVRGRNDMLKKFAEDTIQEYNLSVTTGDLTQPYPHASVMVLELLAEWELLMENQDIPSMKH